MATTNTVRFTADTNPAIKSIDKLQDRVQSASAAFNKLGAAIAGIGITSAITNAIAFADSINDIADATDLSIQSVLGFTNAIANNAGSVQGAQKALLNLSTAIETAGATGGQSLKDFQALGITLNDLATLSNEDLLRKTINGLGELEDSNKRAAIAARLLGKESRAVNFADAARGFGSAVASAQQYRSAILNASAAQGNIDQSLFNLRIAILELVEPLTKIVSGFTASISVLKGVLAAAAAVAAAFLLFNPVVAVLRTVFAVLASIGSVLLSIGPAIAQATTYVVNLVRNFGALITNIRTAGGGFRSLLASISAVVEVIAGPFIAVISRAIAFIRPFVKELIVLGAGVAAFFEGAYNSISKFFGFAQDQKVEPVDTAKAKRDLEILQRMKVELDKFKFSQRDIAESYEDGNLRLVERINFEQKLIGLSDQQRRIEEIRQESLERQADAIRNLQRQRAQLQLDIGTDPQAAAKIAEINKTIETIRNTTVNTEERLVSAQGQLSAMISLEQDRVDLLARERSELEKIVTDLRERDRVAIMEIYDLEQQRAEQLLQLSRAQGLAAEERQRQEKAINDRIDERRKYVEQNLITTTAEQEKFVTGWQSAFERWRNNLQTEAEYGAAQFANVTKGFEDAIVNFVQTGKLSFKSLFNSLIAEAARASANKLLLSIFGLAGGSTGGNILSSIFGGFFANGGNPPVGKVSVVGERGPELFVPKNAGTIIPNEAIIGGGTSTVNNTEVVYNINAVDASSFRSLVARDPEFIFNVSEAGRRSLPTRSRR